MALRMQVFGDTFLYELDEETTCTKGGLFDNCVLLENLVWFLSFVCVTPPTARLLARRHTLVRFLITHRVRALFKKCCYSCAFFNLLII